MFLHVRTYIPLLQISQTARRIAFIFGVRLETHYLDMSFTQVRIGVHLHVRTYPFSHIFQTAGRIVLKFVVRLRDPLDKSFTQIREDVQLQVRTCTPLFHSSQTAGRIAFNLVVWLGTD